MTWHKYHGGVEWASPTFNWGVALGWTEMLVGISIDAHPGTVLISVGVGPLFVWVNIGG